jgi:hypothetical protein
VNIVHKGELRLLQREGTDTLKADNQIVKQLPDATGSRLR